MFSDWKDTFKCKRISGARARGGGEGGVVGLLMVVGRRFGGVLALAWPLAWSV